MVTWAPRKHGPADDPTGGGDRSAQAWGGPSKPLTAADREAVFGGVGTQFFGGIIADDPTQVPADLRWPKAIDTYDAMWRDGTCAATLNVCRLPLLGAGRTIVAASADPQDVQIAQEISDNLLYGLQGGWKNYLHQRYLYRFKYGHAVFEKCWAKDASGKERLRKLAPRLARTLYRWFPNEDDELDRILQRVWINDPSGTTGKYELLPIPATKLVVSVRDREGNDFRGKSLFWHAYTHWRYKTGLYKVDAVAGERNGMGVPNVEEPLQVRQESDRKRASQTLAEYRAGERAFAQWPAGWKFSLVGVSGQVRPILPSIEHHDLLIPKSILAMFVNLDSGGTLIAARDSSSFFLEALQSEGDYECEEANALIREMVDYNYAVDRYPTMQMAGLEQRDLDSYLRGVAALFTAKVLTPNATTENAFRDYLDLPDLPPEPSAAGGGVPTVDSDSQGDSQDPTQPGGDPTQREQLRRLARRFGLRERGGNTLTVTVPARSQWSGWSQPHGA